MVEDWRWVPHGYRIRRCPLVILVIRMKLQELIEIVVSILAPRARKFISHSITTTAFSVS